MTSPPSRSPKPILVALASSFRGLTTPVWEHGAACFGSNSDTLVGDRTIGLLEQLWANHEGPDYKVKRRATTIVWGNVVPGNRGQIIEAG